MRKTRRQNPLLLQRQPHFASQNKEDTMAKNMDSKNKSENCRDAYEQNGVQTGNAQNKEAQNKSSNKSSNKTSNKQENSY